MEYVSRSSAMRSAKSLGWEHFRTVRHPLNRTWRAYQIYATQYPDVSWANGKDFVAWTEVHRDDKGKFHAVLIVSCTRDELIEENIPDHFIIEPQVDELFESQGTRPVTTRTSAPKTERAKSLVLSPTKLVWEVADSMPNASRADIIAACVAKGVNAATASTQFSKWRKARAGV